MWGDVGERWGEVGRGGERWGEGGRGGERWGEARVIQLAGPHERDGGPVQPEQALKGGEGEQQRLNEERAPPSRHPPHWWKDGQASSSASYELETTGTSRQSAEPANTPPRQLSSGTYGGIWGDLGRCGEMWGRSGEDLGRCGEIWWARGTVRSGTLLDTGKDDDKDRGPGNLAYSRGDLG